MWELVHGVQLHVADRAVSTGSNWSEILVAIQKMYPNDSEFPHAFDRLAELDKESIRQGRFMESMESQQSELEKFSVREKYLLY